MPIAPARTLIFAFLLLAASPLVAQYKCYKCKGTNFVECKEKACDPRRACGIDIPHRCTAVLRAPCCRGLRKKLCPRCKDPVAEVELAQELDLRKAWLERQEAIEKRAGVRFETVETDNFITHWSIGKWRSGMVFLTPARAAHLFASRAEETAERFKNITGTLPGSKQILYLVKDANQNFRVSLELMGTGHKNGFKLRSNSGRYVTWPTRPALATDELLHANVVHNAVHLLTFAVAPVHQELSGWLDVGLAHWIERDQFGSCRTYCFSETQMGSAWEKGNWERMLFSEVSSNEAMDLAEILPLNMDKMDHRAHAHCWSFMDFLIEKDRAKFQEFFRSIKASNDGRKAIDEVYDMSTAAFDDAWKAYVRKAYAQ